MIAVLATSSCSLATSAHDPLCYSPKSELEREGPHRKALCLSTIAPISRDLAYERHVRPIETGCRSSVNRIQLTVPLMIETSGRSSIRNTTAYRELRSA